MKTSDYISFIALVASFVVPILIFTYGHYADEIMPKQERSVLTGCSDTIYFSRFNKEHDIVLDLCNRNKNALSNPELNNISDSLKLEMMKKAYEESQTRSTVLYVLDSKDTPIDSVKISCFDCITIGLTVPPKGSLVLKCVSGCLNNFCSYEFVKL